MALFLSERFPFWILKCCQNGLNVRLNCIMADYIPIGMQFLVNGTELMKLIIKNKC